MRGITRVVAAATAVALFSLAAMAGTAMAATPTISLEGNDPDTPKHAGDHFIPQATVKSASDDNDAAVSIFLYALGDTTCSGTPIDSQVFDPGHGNNDDYWDEPGMLAPGVGTYYGQAKIDFDPETGDPAAASDCIPVVTTTKATPDLKVQPSNPHTTTGSLIHVNGFLLGYSLGGAKLEMKIFGPGDDSCAGAPLVTTQIDGASGQFTGTDYQPTVPGVYHLYARYAGNDFNEAVSSPCNAGTAITVTQAPPGTESVGGGSKRTGKRAAALKRCSKVKKKKAKKACVKKARKLPL